MERSCRRSGHLTRNIKNHFGSLHRRPVEKVLWQKVHLHECQQGRGGDGQDLAFAADCLLLERDVEGCSSHMGSKTIAWSEMSPGGASGLV